jgi:hypothetical protein
MARNLVIEFVPREDSQVQRLLATRPDTFANYSLTEFQRTFSERFSIDATKAVPGTARTLLAMRRRP